MIKRVCFFILVLIGLVFIFDVSYLFYGVRCTYLRGEKSAQIDDSKFFFNRTVSMGAPLFLPNSVNYNTGVINDSLDLLLNQSKSVAFLVVQNDSICFERYWGDGSQNSQTNSFSVAKSIVSLLVGCAVDRGFISSVDQSVFDFLPELRRFDGHDVKIKHLLEMSSGLDWLEDYKKPISVTAKSYYGTNIRDVMFGRGFVYPPGEYYEYKSGDTQLLGFILERATGKSVSDFASDVLWGKIGAENNALWTLDSENGFEKTFCCFNSSARDFSKIGLLFLNSGFFNGQQIVSKKYMDWLVTRPHLIDIKTGELVDYYSNGWWSAIVSNKIIYYARGFNGQYIVVVPDLNLVFVRLGFFENESTKKDNDYLMYDNLLFFVKEVIKEYSY